MKMSHLLIQQIFENILLNVARFLLSSIRRNKMDKFTADRENEIETPHLCGTPSLKSVASAARSPEVEAVFTCAKSSPGQISASLETSFMKALSSRKKCEAGISLVETMVAMAVTVAALAGLSASTQQATRLARAGKNAASASEMIEERLEAFRYTTTWSKLTTGAGIASVTSAPTAISSNFPNATETFTVQPYPTGSQLIVVRSPSGSFTDNGVDLSTTKCVKLTVAATWTASGASPHNTEFSTIITKGGL